MNASMIILLIKNLGRPYESLISEGVIPNAPLRELYEGRGWLDIEPEDGWSWASRLIPDVWKLYTLLLPEPSRGRQCIEINCHCR
jgi:hypothetical protein